MTKNEMIDLLKSDVKAWNKWRKKSPIPVDLSESNLSGVNLSWADLHGVDLSWADLYRTNLFGANLSRSNLSHANLSSVTLYYANLSDANLSDANLSHANLYDANLSDTNLYYANLSDANLLGSSLPPPTMVLLANWDEVSDDLCRDLMRYDAFFHPNPFEFLDWVKDGPCPYTYKKFQRVCNFNERRDLYSPGIVDNGFNLMVRLIREKCRNSDYH